MEGRRMMWIIMIGIITVVGGIGLWLTRKHS
ncbi:LPXTG cell wall anchor domain-containing protein [Bilophila wadsworthia]|jgi:LPXTG-motif cell wall-anchored protein|nr:LPXTG cell wall anchor domain-containing protein [Bilophila wadsworthia]MBS5376645.1 LPXTG cell wall anchor domain-containing protein [Bilophila wadsworthia]MCB8573611.1 LPXTG cell wall anchor domain-containing protein [Bilophila wadsworthia]MDU4377395.1 LPXTG cell wall anchor domain-containing protein [Bilophila wadsworthia]